MRPLSLLAVLSLAACVTTATPRGIALDFASYLKMIRDAPLSIRCQHVKDTMERCQRNGFPPDCAWDGFSDADDDDFTIKACLARIEAERAEDGLPALTKVSSPVPPAP